MFYSDTFILKTINKLLYQNLLLLNLLNYNTRKKYTSIITVHLSSNCTVMLFHLTLSESQTAYANDSFVFMLFCMLDTVCTAHEISKRVKSSHTTSQYLKFFFFFNILQ